MSKQPDPTIEISYTLHGHDGSIDDASASAAQVPRVGELVAIGHWDSYQVVDVLWHVIDEKQHVTITACEYDWHQHIKDVLQSWKKTVLPATDSQHLVMLMRLIDWSSDHQSETSTDSAIPTELNHTLDRERWIMLQNALIDWDIIRASEYDAHGDALFRLAVVYTLPVFENAPAETDRALGNLLGDKVSGITGDESAEVIAGLGRRWREDLCATAWRLVLADRQRKR